MRYAMAITRSIAVSLLAVVVFVAAVPPRPASAHYFNLIKMDDRWVDFASDEDNNDHFLYWNHFVHYQMFDRYFAADVVLSGSEQCRWCWNDGTDMVWFASPISSVGDEVCRKVRPNGTCDRARVRYRENLTRQIPDDTAWFIVCHEAGHVTGLDDYSDGCMHGSINLSYPPGDGTLSSHMKGHINVYY